MVTHLATYHLTRLRFRLRRGCPRAHHLHLVEQRAAKGLVEVGRALIRVRVKGRLRVRVRDRTRVKARVRAVASAATAAAANQQGVGRRRQGLG